MMKDIGGYFNDINVSFKIDYEDEQYFNFTSYD